MNRNYAELKKVELKGNKKISSNKNDSGGAWEGDNSNEMKAWSLKFQKRKKGKDDLCNSSPVHTENQAPLLTNINLKSFPLDSGSVEIVPPALLLNPVLEA